MLIIYRISNTNSRGKPKVPGATKAFCLQNAWSMFPNADWLFIADNCDEETIQLCEKKDFTFVTNLGNCGAFRLALNLACNSLDDDDLIYLMEDDYLHNENSEAMLQQGLQKADYVTLYNHPDKFEKRYDFGEIAKVIRIGQTYWKHTISTTMTFAARAKTLKEDRDTWIKFTQGAVPHDHKAFCSLDRALICPIPGLSCHMDLSDSNEEYLPNWVVEKLSIPFKELLGEQFPEFSYAETPLRQLKIMQALVDIGRK
ncbi:MAG: hypothetical protein M0R80_03165 [Proteobacteria bacterium]|jgi:glycosyltransferase involved in cell wall biosynthesis|nr:hypothetical protein [Pseudomonadota bacterium]